jgi:hypothetical protein
MPVKSEREARRFLPLAKARGLRAANSMIGTWRRIASNHYPSSHKEDAMLDYIPEVVELEVIGPHALHIRFDDGIVRRIDLTKAINEGPLNKGVFEPLKDPMFFAQAYIDIGTVCWPGDVDIAPESLYADLWPDPDESGSDESGSLV